MTLRRFAPPECARLEIASQLRKALGFPQIAVAQQVHGNQIDRIDDLTEGKTIERLGADGLVTNRKGVLLGVFTADCVPIVLADPTTQHLAVLHAGREGTRLRIVENALRNLLRAGCAPENIHAWIAPAICHHHYEVNPSMAEAFAEEFPEWPDLVSGRNLALAEANRRMLLSEGMRHAQIALDPQCTLESEDLFYSYRRERAAAGRMMTFAGWAN